MRGASHSSLVPNARVYLSGLSKFPLRGVRPGVFINSAARVALNISLSSQSEDAGVSQILKLFKTHSLTVERGPHKACGAGSTPAASTNIDIIRRVV